MTSKQRTARGDKLTKRQITRIIQRADTLHPSRPFSEPRPSRTQAALPAAYPRFSMAIITKAMRTAAYDAGYKDAINGAPCASHDPNSEHGTHPELSMFYALGYEEGFPKRRVPTVVLTSRGPARAIVSLEEADFLLAPNHKTPGGRR